MISRVADHCFWFGRYLERAESTARLLQVTSGLSLDSDLTPLQRKALREMIKKELDARRKR